MTIGLRKMPDKSAGHRIEPFSEQPHVIAAREQPIKELLGLGVSALQYVVVDQPKAARQKNSFARGQAVAGIFGFVSEDEFVADQQPVLNRRKCSLYSRISCWKKADE